MLLSTMDLCNEIQREWGLVYKDGLHQHFIESMEESTENARNTLFAWRNEMEHTNNQVTGLLYHSWLTRIREISDQLLRLVQHFRQARLSFSVLAVKDEVPLAVQIRAGDNLLDHLTAVEALLVDDEAERRFPGWHTVYRTISEAVDLEKRRDLVLSADRTHPLYAWLVQSVLAQS